jgi:hypothetical protein
VVSHNYLFEFEQLIIKTPGERKAKQLRPGLNIWITVGSHDILEITKEKKGFKKKNEIK